MLQYHYYYTTESKAHLSVVSVVHHVSVVVPDHRSSLVQSPTVLLQVLVASPYHSNEIQLTCRTHIHDHITEGSNKKLFNSQLYKQT